MHAVVAVMALGTVPAVGGPSETGGAPLPGCLLTPSMYVDCGLGLSGSLVPQPLGQMLV